MRSCAYGVSLLAWFFRDIGVSSGTNAAEERLFLLPKKAVLTGMIDRKIDQRKIQVGKTVLFKYGGVEIPAKVTGSGNGMVEIELTAALGPIPWSLRVQDISGIVSQEDVWDL